MSNARKWNTYIVVTFKYSATSWDERRTSVTKYINETLYVVEIYLRMYISEKHLNGYFATSYRWMLSRTITLHLHQEIIWCWYKANICYFGTKLSLIKTRDTLGRSCWMCLICFPNLLAFSARTENVVWGFVNQFLLLICLLLSDIFQVLGNNLTPSLQKFILFRIN